jgi:hypothetical protein
LRDERRHGLLEAEGDDATMGGLVVGGHDDLLSVGDSGFEYFDVSSCEKDLGQMPKDLCHVTNVLFHLAKDL